MQLMVCQSYNRTQGVEFSIREHQSKRRTKGEGHVLLDNCGNGLLKEILTSLYSRVNLLRATSITRPERLPNSLREVDKLFEALKARDVSAAQTAARLHISDAEKAAMRVLDEVEGKNK